MNEGVKLIEISGTVSNIIYKNEENGYCVAELELEDGGETIIVGSMPFLGVSEYVTAWGGYVNHQEYGAQFSVSILERKLPGTLRGICEYLSSRTIKGIGPKTARAIVDMFKEDSFDVISTQHHRLTAIKGISLEKAQAISDNFNQQNTMRMILDFLLTHELPMSFAPGLYYEYGEQTVKLLNENPYLMCKERFALDFMRADGLALKLGIEEQSPVRLKAALVYELSFNLESGHIFIPRDQLLDITQRLCGGDGESLESQLDYLCQTGEVVQEKAGERSICYLYDYHYFENFVAQSVVRLMKTKLVRPENFEKIFSDVQKSLSITYQPEQIAALKAPFENALCVITGGPGTGKTTTILGLMKLFDSYGLNVSLAAPTGRAAKRMSELTGVEAKTIHRLLEATYIKESGTIQFKKNLENPLEADILIVDEASMVDMKLAASLFYALKHHARVILVGDKDQLPPVGAGSFFGDLIDSKQVCSIALKHIFRQGEGSRIVQNAYEINCGRYPDLASNNGDFYFASVKTPQGATDNIVSLMCDRIPNHFGIKTCDIQIICPTRQMSCGTQTLNKLLQDRLNPPKGLTKEVRFGSSLFRVGDRVMQMKNNYDVVWVKPQTGEAGTGIFNGDTGVITFIDKQVGVMNILFDDREASYTLEELGQIEHAYAITVHKAQGSEYDAVILPVFEMPHRLINRTTLYTAVTRAKKLLVIVGKSTVIMQMVDSNNKNKRYSALKSRIKKYYGAVSGESND